MLQNNMDVTTKNVVNEGGFLQDLLNLVPWCDEAPPPHHPLFHAANTAFLVGFMAPPSRIGKLVMHTCLIIGFLIYSTWAWNILCARNVFSWGFAFTLLNLAQTLYVLYQTRPVKTDRELESVFYDMFRPLNVERLVFKRLMSADICQISSLHSGEAYAMQNLTRTDRLGILLSGKVNVFSGEQYLHSIGAMEFLDSPEFESSRAAVDDKFKVSIVAATTSRYLFWKRSSLEYLFMKDQHLATVLSTLIARDITSKLYNMNSKIITEKGSHLDIRLPSLTSTLSPSFLGQKEEAKEEVKEEEKVSPLIKGESMQHISDTPNEAGLFSSIGGGFGAPFGYSNSSRVLLTGENDSLSKGEQPPVVNKSEHPLH